MPTGDFRFQERLGRGSFTRFGVGCSFSDSPQERAERASLMEQASRGLINTLAPSGKDAT